MCNSPRYFFNALQARNRDLLRFGGVTDEVENTSFCYRFSPFAKKRKASCSVCGYLHSVGCVFKLPAHLSELQLLRFQQGARHRSKMGRCTQIVVKNLAPLGFLHPPAFFKTSCPRYLRKSRRIPRARHGIRMACSSLCSVLHIERSRAIAAAAVYQTSANADSASGLSFILPAR